jgi:hypothetical protein
VIHDVAQFLAKPVLQAANGSAVRLELKLEHVSDLLNNRSTQVSLSGQSLTLLPESAPSTSSDVRGATAAIKAGGTNGSSLPTRSMGLNMTSASPVADFRAVSVAPVNPQLKGVATNIPGWSSLPQQQLASAPQLGFYVPYLQTWTLLGYSRGALLNTIALSPQEETTIELFTWDRRTDALEQTSSSDVEQEHRKH